MKEFYTTLHSYYSINNSLLNDIFTYTYWKFDDLSIDTLFITITMVIHKVYLTFMRTLFFDVFPWCYNKMNWRRNAKQQKNRRTNNWGDGEFGVVRWGEVVNDELSDEVRDVGGDGDFCYHW